MKSVAVVLLVLVSAPSFARAWREIEPAVSGREDVIRLFGEPSRVKTTGNEEQLAYFGERAIKGTRQTQFRVEVSSGVVMRIDLFPRQDVTQEAIENSYGPPCRDTSRQVVEGNCYQRVMSADLGSYLYYRELGLAVYLRGDGSSVRAMAFTPTDATLAAHRARSPTLPPVRAQQGEEGAPPGSEDSSPSASASAEASAETSDFAVDEVGDAPTDRLEIGAKLFLLAFASGSGAWAKPNSGVTTPALLDVYLDGRPNDRVRAMIVGRLSFNPTADALPAFGQPGLGGRGPNVILDQLWLKFDLGRILFATLGRQHANWGVGRIWTPGDLLRPRRTDVLGIFDPRVGIDMLKLHLPLESLGWNVYAVGLADTSKTTVQPGAAARAEFVLGPVELGLSTRLLRGSLPLYAADLSAGIGPVDLYGEAVLSPRPTRDSFRSVRNPDTGERQTEAFTAAGRAYELVGGLAVPILFSHSELTFSAEYYRNSAGYTERAVLPDIISARQSRPFYQARDYASAGLGYRDTGSDDERAASVRVMANISDRSLLGRVDLSARVLRDLRVELFATLPFGQAGGEFRYAGTVREQIDAAGAPVAPAFDIPLPLYTAGLAFRLEI